MASKGSKSPRRTEEDLYTRVLRVKRRDILRELPDTKELLKDARLEKMFTRFEKGEITSQKTPTENAEKLVRALEFKGYESYNIFVSVLREYRPSLAEKLVVAGEEIRADLGSSNNNGNTGPSSSSLGNQVCVCRNACH